jgi:asparagine synthase (glutamine-hydrolysing)
MCGIAGGFALAPGGRVEIDRVARMTAMLRHRGPDGEGIWSAPDGRACLGHRRLSVIDLATGQQPMRDAETGAVIVFNGEIYNYLELRDELMAAGHAFRTDSDTEVILALYRRAGTDLFRQLRGMFAFALWDPGSATLLLARDRVGKKPLYYVVEDGVLYFGSSFGAVRSVIRSPRAVDLRQLDAFLTLGYIPAPATIHPLIRKLPAGTFVTATAEGLRPRPFWDIARDVRPFDGTRDQAVEHLDELVNTAVRIRLRSDVPVGVLLSGGVDSSLVAAVAARQSRTRVLTFSLGFPDAVADEAPYAAAVARHIDAEHHTLRTHSRMIDLVPELVRHFGEPFGDPSAAPTSLIAREAREHVTVAIGGDGGDEGFAGYDWYRTAARVARLHRMVPVPLRRPALLESPSLPAFGRLGRLSRAAALVTLDDAARYRALRALLDPRLAHRLYTRDLEEIHRGASAEWTAGLDALFDETPGSHLRRMRTADLKTYLPECLMPKLDVATMAHGLEARAPLLDHEILQFGLGLPDEWITDGQSGKGLLRAVLERYLPARLFERPKRGFDPPLASWFNGMLRPRVEQLLGSEALLETGWFHGDGLRAIGAEHLAGQRDHSLRLYNLLVLDEWLRQR